MKDFLLPIIELLNEMTPYLLSGFLIAGILHEFVPRSIYAKRLSKNNFASVFWATMFGIPLPLCSCGVIPTAASIRRAGASKGATVAFIISTPQTGVDSILATASLLGVPFAILRPFVAIVTALVGGAAVNALCREDKSEKESAAENEEKKSFLQKCIGTLRYGFVDMIQDLGKWIVIGLVIAAIITVAVPDEFFTRFNDYPILNMLVILTFSVPMYLCATGAIPIAAALMLKGLSPGAALLLLIAGPATNTAAILVINKVLGRKTLLIYLFTIIIGTIGFGSIVDYLLPAEWFTAAAHSHSAGCCHVHDTPWWQTASSIIFVLLLVTAFILRYRKKGDCCHCGGECHCDGDCHCEGHCNDSCCSAEKRFRIEGMMCNHCKANVEKCLKEIEGITEMRVELTEGAAYIKGENIDPKKIIEAIEAIGYRCKED